MEALDRYFDSQLRINKLLDLIAIQTAYSDIELEPKLGHYWLISDHCVQLEVVYQQGNVLMAWENGVYVSSVLRIGCELQVLPIVTLQGYPPNYSDYLQDFM